MPPHNAFGHHGGQLPDDDRKRRAHRRGYPRLLARQPAHQAQPQLKGEMQSQLGTAKELLARLVAFDTTSHKSNIPLVAFVEEYLRGHGVDSVRVPTAD